MARFINCSNSSKPVYLEHLGKKIGFQNENFKKSSCLKLQGLEPSYFIN